MHNFLDDCYAKYILHMENAHYEKINTKFLQARNLGTRNKFPGPSVQKLVIG